MDKERFVEIIKTGTFTDAHLEELGELVRKYPWFALPRFLRLKVYEQMEGTPEASELNGAVVFSSDRKHLYDWVKGTFDSMIGTFGQGSTELEFLDSEAEDTDEGSGDEEPFVLLDDDVENEDDADSKPIPEKDDTEMEEPELEAPDTVPVIDPLDDEEDEDEEDDRVDEDEEDADTAGKLPEDAKVADAAAETGPFDEAESGRTGSGAGDETAGMKRGDERGQTGDENVSKGKSTLLTASGNASGNSRQTIRTNPSTDLIERFLKKEPGVIRADQQTNLEGDVSESSLKEDDALITDTLAKIYVKQGLHAKAIYAYERLSLKYPEKSAYFAAQIEKIKNNANI